MTERNDLADFVSNRRRYLFLVGDIYRYIHTYTARISFFSRDTPAPDAPRSSRFRVLLHAHRRPPPAATTILSGCTPEIFYSLSVNPRHFHVANSPYFIAASANECQIKSENVRAGTPARKNKKEKRTERRRTEDVPSALHR